VGEAKGVRRPRWVVHPLLFAAVPVLLLFAANTDEGLSPGQLIGPLLVVLTGTAVVWGIAWLAFGHNLARAGLLTTLLVVLFFIYGAVHGALEGHHLLGLDLGQHRILLVVWLALAAWGVWLAAHTGAGLAEVTGALNVIAAVLVLINAFSIGYSQARAHSAPSQIPGLENVSLHWTPRAGMTRPPDIYYVMFEEYAGPAALRDQFGFDNSPFLDALAAKGFHVVATPHTNYPRTSLSLASSLNLSYLDFLTQRDGRNTGDASPLRELMKDHLAGRLLRAAGYEFDQLGSWWEPTSNSPLADRNITYGGWSDFTNILYQSTALWPVAQRVPFLADRTDARRRDWRSVQFQFDQLAQLGAKRGPKPRLVFAHILIPHAPYVFTRDGSYVSLEQEVAESGTDAYVRQLEYTNTRILQLMDHLLSVPEAERPVILLQSDEGPYAGAPTSWKRIPARALERKFGILNAYYLPGPVPATGSAGSEIPSTMTPVNSFRLVFDRYFGTKLPLLPDQEFVFRDLQHLYDFSPVTDLLTQRGQ
jgi:hypothetical protein